AYAHPVLDPYLAGDGLQGRGHARAVVPRRRVRGDRHRHGNDGGGPGGDGHLLGDRDPGAAVGGLGVGGPHVEVALGGQVAVVGVDREVHRLGGAVDDRHVLDDLLAAGEFEVDDAAAVGTVGAGRYDRPGGVGAGRAGERYHGGQQSGEDGEAGEDASRAAYGQRVSSLVVAVRGPRRAGAGPGRPERAVASCLRFRIRCTFGTGRRSGLVEQGERDGRVVLAGGDGGGGAQYEVGVDLPGADLVGGVRRRDQQFLALQTDGRRS